ncbi:integrase [Aeromicrobium sp. Root495]|uniref:tyrosine-type recombinase/integrase n=1 Tax=Aeromicrobium sp. Root495 TaxID=1736550 RepID=UPI000701B224|nr:site-specific integrase [Aeromicrobium sp. Root495]KQY55756.1 integrase [Aeromicrobium sp. Root495]
MPGNIARRPDGRWRARYRDETGRERSRHFEKKIAAQRWLDEVASSVLTGNYVDPSAGRVTYRDFYAEWSANQLWLPNSRRNADQAVRSVPFGDVQLKTIRRSHIERWIKEMSERLAPTTIKTRFVIVRSVFRAAVADRVIASDPCLGVVLPRRRKAEAAMHLPSVVEVGRLLANADSPRVSTRRGFRAYVALCAFAGLRKGEASAVQVRDIDFEQRLLHVRRQVQREYDELVVRLPKYGSERTIYLPDELLVVLREHIIGQLPRAHAEDWLFTVDGEPLDDNAVTWRWRATRNAVYLPTVRLHDLRHFYASGLIAAGCDVVTVQRALGHASATTTLSTYSHLWPTAADRTRNAASDLLRQSLGLT